MGCGCYSFQQASRDFTKAFGQKLLSFCKTRKENSSKKTTYWLFLFYAYLYVDQKTNKQTNKKEQLVLVAIIAMIKHILIECANLLLARKK